jgi:hypothetical protein
MESPSEIRRGVVILAIAMSAQVSLPSHDEMPSQPFRKCPKNVADDEKNVQFEAENNSRSAKNLQTK